MSNRKNVRTSPNAGAVVKVTKRMVEWCKAHPHHCGMVALEYSGNRQHWLTEYSEMHDLECSPDQRVWWAAVLVYGYVDDDGEFVETEDRRVREFWESDGLSYASVLTACPPLEEEVGA